MKETIDMKRAVVVLLCLLAVFAAGFVIGWMTAVPVWKIAVVSAPTPGAPNGRSEVRATTLGREPAVSQAETEGDSGEELREYFGFPRTWGPPTGFEITDAMVEAGIRKALQDFISVWKDPNPITGYSWDDQEKDEKKLRERLSYIGLHDYRHRISAGQIKSLIGDASLSKDLRGYLYSLLVEIRPRAEIKYFEEQLHSTKDPWMHSAALGYLLRNRDVKALAIAITESLEKRSIEGKLDLASSIAAYFGEDVELDVPSKHWGVIFTDHPEDMKEELDLLVEDIRAWWKEHGGEYERQVR